MHLKEYPEAEKQNPCFFYIKNIKTQTQTTLKINRKHRTQIKKHFKNIKNHKKTTDLTKTDAHTCATITNNNKLEAWIINSLLIRQSLH